MEKLSLTGKSKHTTDETMRGLSAVLIDGDDIFIDNGAIHGKSRVERGITFVRRPEEVTNPRSVLGFWITLSRHDNSAQGYYGAMPFELLIDAEAATGFKPLAAQVNGMEKAIKGQVDISSLDVQTKRRLREFLTQIRQDLWENAHDSFREAFADS